MLKKLPGTEIKFLACGSLLAMAPVCSELRAKCQLIVEL